jgi:hypothetical protein
MFWINLRRISSIITLITCKLENLMAQIDDLTVALTAATAGLTSLAADVNALVAALQSHPAAPDLTSEIAAANAISTGLSSIDSSVKAALTPPATTTTTATSATVSP